MSTSGETLYKQVYELSIDDLAEHPIWEFFIGDELEHDEATVRPFASHSDLPRPDQAMLVVRTNFISADGTRFCGYATPSADGHLGRIQPNIVTPRGQIAFWKGRAEPDGLELQRAYAMLGKYSDEIFPLSYESDMRTPGRPIEGVIPGFIYLGDDDLPHAVR